MSRREGRQRSHPLRMMTQGRRGKDRMEPVSQRSILGPSHHQGPVSPHTPLRLATLPFHTQNVGKDFKAVQTYSWNRGG